MGIFRELLNKCLLCLDTCHPVDDCDQQLVIDIRAACNASISLLDNLEIYGELESNFQTVMQVRHLKLKLHRNS